MRSGDITPVFLTSALDGGEWSASRSGRFTPGKEPPYSLYRRLDKPGSLCGSCEKDKISYTCRQSNPCHPSPYWLSSPGSFHIVVANNSGLWIGWLDLLAFLFQLQSMTAQVSLNSLLDHECLHFHWDESLLTHWTPLRMPNDWTLLNWTNFQATQIYITTSNSSCHSVFPLPRNVLTVPLPSNRLFCVYLLQRKRMLGKSLASNRLRSGSTIPAFRRHVTIYMCM
jgi:hypothetical protein